MFGSDMKFENNHDSSITERAEVWENPKLGLNDYLRRQSRVAE